MGMRTWAALRTPVGTKAEFEFRPQDLKGQVSDLLSCLYNPANWRAAVIRLSATVIFSSVPRLETFSFPRHLSRLDAVYEITGMERTCFSPQEQTQPEIFILLADCTEWMGSLEEVSRHRVRVWLLLPQSSVCTRVLLQAPQASQSTEKSWVPSTAVHSPQWLLVWLHVHQFSCVMPPRLPVSGLCLRNIAVPPISRRPQPIAQLHCTACTTEGQHSNPTRA